LPGTNILACCAWSISDEVKSLFSLTPRAYNTFADRFKKILQVPRLQKLFFVAVYQNKLERFDEHIQPEPDVI
jgi:hypothetical protein